MKKNTMKLFGLSTIALLLVTGCGKVPKLENGQDAVVTLKGNDISVNTLYNEVKERYALDALLKLIDTEILNKKYKDTKDSKQEVQDQINLMIQQYGNGSEATLLQATYQAWGISTMDELTKYLTLQYKRNKAVEDYAKSLVTDNEIQKYYDDEIFGDLTVKHILITPDVDSNATAAEKEDAEKNALKEAKEVISKLNNGEDWDKLAKEYSDDSSNASKGGLLPTFTNGEMQEEFEKASLELEDGKYTTEPVKTSYGYHIIYRVKQAEKPKLKTVKSDIIDELYKEKLTNDPTIQVTALVELRKDYKVKIQDDDLKDQYERYIENQKKSLTSSNQ